jgi:hypothetical protein
MFTKSCHRTLSKTQARRRYRAYDMFRAYEGMEGKKIKIKKLKVG